MDWEKELNHNLESNDYFEALLCLRMLPVDIQAKYKDRFEQIIPLPKANLNQKSLVRSELDILNDSLKTLHNMEDQSKAIMLNLENQREKIDQINTKSKEIKSETNSSNTILNKMLRWYRG